MASKGGKVVAAKMSGKLKTVFQMVTIAVALMGNIPFAFVNFPMSEILVWICCGISIYSGIEYFNETKEFIMESK